ncbi:MAG TPA: universal stress protein [Streptosporangiaceae bacterium]|nr:universal stress protein [Streptosporangiaceae bacterium]
MLVLGSRGAGGFTRLMMGWVAGQVAQHTYCPVQPGRAAGQLGGPE